MRQLRRDRLNQICKQFQMKKYSSASRVIERMKKELKRDKKFIKQVKDVIALIIKSRQQAPFYTPLWVTIVPENFISLLNLSWQIENIIFLTKTSTI